jgi:hypothetical protein
MDTRSVTARNFRTGESEGVMNRLPPTRKSKRKRRNSPGHYESMQAAYRNILEKLERDVNADLEQIERFDIGDMLKMVLQGFDVRKILGIKPRRGAPTKNKCYGLGVATHYYLFCDTEANEKTAASKVAHDWGISLTAVRRIASENREAYLEWTSAATLILPADTRRLPQVARVYLEPWIHQMIQAYR